MKTTTSLNFINGDYPLGVFQKVLFYGLNLADNYWAPRSTDVELREADFSCPELESKVSAIFEKSSPSRLLGDLFWYSLSWETIRQKLGGKINVFDVGCGSGIYHEKLQKFSQEGIDFYKGVDVKESERWDFLIKDGNCRFETYNGKDIISQIPYSSNLIMTQSAIEHFDQDLRYFENIRKFVDQKQSPCLQIHLFPGPASLFLYKCHGYRQYTPRKISKISRIFSGDGQVCLYPLGGKATARLHQAFLNLKDVEGYKEDFLKAVKEDSDVKKVSQVVFYAMVIATGFNEEVEQLLFK